MKQTPPTLHILHTLVVGLFKEAPTSHDHGMMHLPPYPTGENLMRKLLTAEEEILLSNQVHNGDEDAAEKLLLANLGLVVHIAQRIPAWHLGGALTRDDMIQEGNLALLHAARTYKPQGRFASYARKVIHSRIMRAIENTGQMIRVPVPVQEDLRKIKRTEATLLAQFKREPTIQEVAQATGMTLAKVRDRLAVGEIQPTSLDVFRNTEEIDYE